MNDITKTGSSNGAELRQYIQQIQSGQIKLDQEKLKQAKAQYSPVQTAASPESYLTTYYNSGLSDFGQSIYDAEEFTLGDVENQNLGDIRAENQPWYAKLGAGVAKGLGNAATSFLSGTVGIAYGLGSVAAGGSFWDNDFNKAMDDVNQAMEEWLPNYYTRDEIQNPLAWRNIFSANTLGDKLIKNLGFSVGMIYGGGVVSGILKATRLPRLLTKLTGSAKVGRAFTSLVASTTAAAGEANIEAYRGAAEQVKAQTAMAEMEYDDAVRALMDVYTPAIQAGDQQAIAELNTRISELEAQKNAKIQLIKDNGRKAGDTIWLGNMAVLMPSNLIQFGKVFTRGLSGMRGNMSLAGSIGNYKSATGKAQLLWGIGKGAITEGMEEISQGSITRGTANYYEKQLDLDAQEQTKGIMSEITDALTESFVTDQGKEEFLLGAVTGALGIPMVGKRSNGKLGLKVQGGIFNEISDWKHQRAAETFIADQLNARANDPAFQNYYNGLVRHVSYQKDMNLASLANNEDAYKDYEHSQLISDVIMFDSVGRLGDLESMIKFQSENLSDEELDNIVKATSRIDEESGEIIDGEFVDSFGDTVTPMTATEAGKDAMRKIIKNNADGVLDAINQYRKVATKIDGDTDSSLSDNQLKELTFMAMKIQNYNSKQRDNFKAIKDIILNEPELAAEGTALHELLEKANVDLLNNRIPINDRVAELKRVIDNNPGLLEKLHTMNLEEINPHWIDTILTMQKNKEAYEAKYKEYKENPERQISDHKKQEKEATKKKDKKERKEAQDKAKESTVGDLASDDSLLDELDQTFNPEDADVTSTTDIFSDLTTEEKETKEKTKQAKIVKGLATEASQLLDKAIDKGLSPLVSSIVSKMLNNASARVQKDASEFLDRTAVSYQDDSAIVEALNQDPDFQQASDERKDLIFAETKVEVGQTLDTIVEVLNKAYNKRINTPEQGTKEVVEKDDPTDDHPSKLPQETPSVDITSNTKKVGNSIQPADAELMHLPSNYILDGLDKVTGSIKDEQIDSVVGVKYINTSNNKALVRVGLKDGTTSDVFYNVKHQNNNATVVPTELPSYEDTHPSETENSYFADQLKPSTPRLPIRSPFGDMTPWATILYRLKSAVEKKKSGQELTKEESKYYEFYKDEIEDPNSILNKHKMLTESYIKKAAAIHEYLTKVGTFDAVDSNQVQKGDAITLVVDKELTERVGHPIVLLAKVSDSGEVTIVGDLQKNRSNAALISRVETEYQKYISENPEAERYISNYHTKVTNNFVGRIPFSKREDTSPLNSVFGRNGRRRTFVLGIVKDNSGYIQAEGTDIKTSEIRKMKSSKPGQPVILLETSDTKSNRHYVPVPFIMPTYSAENAETTFLGRQVARVVDDIVRISTETIVSENTIIDIKNELCKTLALDTKDSSVFITFDAANINIDLKINGNRTYIKVPKGENAKQELLTKMQEANIPFIINIKSINDKTEDGDDYNSIIGEIAEVNLHPMRNNHTLSDFFTMEKIPLESEKKTTSTENISSTNIIEYSSNSGQKVSINIDTWEISVDGTIVNDPHHTNGTSNIYRAMAYGRKNNLPQDVPYDTIWGRFDPTRNSFVPQKKGQNGDKLSNTTEESIQDDNQQENKVEREEESKANPSVIINKEQEESLKKKLSRTPNIIKIYDALEDQDKVHIINLGSKAKGVLQQLQNYFDSVSNSFTDIQQVKEILYPTKYRQTQTVEKPSKESQIRREVRWFKRILPNLSQKECLVIVENMLDIKNSNLKAWGKFTEGTIQVFKNAAKGTVYHEAFHAVTNILLSKEEKDRMFNEAAKQYPELAGDEVALEEALAEDFRRYTQKQQIPFIGPIVKVFRKLNITSRRLRNKSMYLDSIYFRINNGDYGKRNIVSAAQGVTRDNAVQEYKDLIRELKYAEKEKEVISDKWEQATQQIKNPKSALGKLSRTRYKSFSEAASNIPNNLVDVLGVYEDHGRYIIDAKNNLDLKDTLNQIQNIIDDTRRALYISENLLESRISDEALDEQEAKYRVANITNIPQENVNNELLEDVTNFFKHFNISLQEVDQYSEQEPLFDALNRVIYYKSNKDITESVGQAMAFMMQHDPMVNKIFWQKSPIYKSLFKFAGLFKNKNKYRAFLYRKLPSKNLVLKGLGHNIAKELQNIYGGKGFVDTNESTATIIQNFFKNWSINSKRSYDLITKYSRNAANSLKLGDYTVIDSTTKKPETGEETSRVHIDQALLENPYEEDIIYKLGQKGYALAGSAALAVQGTVFRPSENPLHDIDFQAQGKSVQDIEEAVNFISPYNKFIRMINNDSGPTYTYLVLDRPFIVERPVKGTAAYVLLDPVTREQYGSYTGSNLILNGDTKGKFLDFFTGEKRYEHMSTTINGKTYLIGNENYAMEAKVDWQRNKDVWDYNRYLPNELYQQIQAEQELSDQMLQSRIEESSIIWGHPAIGKTTYLETHDDIIEWDKEVNPKRNKFIQEQIDPNNELDEYTFNKKRQEYMANFAAHPEYEQFLRNEWQKLKAKAKRQNKKIFASPLPLLRMFPQDFDLVINLNNREFLRNNTNRGGKLFSTMDWKYAINEVLATLPRDKVVNTGKYMSELAEGVNMSPIEQYHNNKFQYDNLSLSDQEYLKEKGITKEEFDSWPAREREIALHCKQ